MKQKKMKGLWLGKETIARLNKTDLEKVRGGAALTGLGSGFPHYGCDETYCGGVQLYSG